MSSPEAEAQRRHNESEFHDRWAARIDPTDTLVDETFTAITAVENQHILAQFGDVRGKRDARLRLRRRRGRGVPGQAGREVVGIDVSAGMLAAAQRLATRHGVKIETRQVTSDVIPADRRGVRPHLRQRGLHHVSLPVPSPSWRG